MATLPALRKKIDAIDTQLIDLLSKRMELSRSVARAKQASAKAGPVFQPTREAQILERLSLLASDALSSDALAAIYREIFSASRALQTPTTVAYLGPQSTFTHQAALAKFGRGANYVACVSIAETFAAIEKGQANYAVVPVENSTEGSVSTTLDRLAEGDFRIIDQLYSKISMQLISRFALSSIKKIYSKDVAFGQCQRFLAAHLPQAELIAVDSTVEAVERAKKTAASAAIAGELAAQSVGVPIIVPNIQDKANNTTRFFVITTPSKSPTTKPQGNGCDRSSYLIAIKDRAGALLDILKPFERAGLSLTKLESRPAKTKAWEYVFFVDIAAHREDPAMKKALHQIEKQSLFVKYLGSYTK